MTRHLPTCFLATALALVALPAQADFALSGHSAIDIFGTPLSSQERIWVSGTAVRRDFSDRGRAYTQLFDLGTRQVMVVDHFTRTAEVHDLAALDAATETTTPAASLKLRLEPTGNSRRLQNWTCREHVLEASVPTRLGAEETLFHLKGRIWFARDVPEQAAVRPFVDAAARPGFFLAVPAVARVAPAYSRVMSEMLRRLAPEGLPCGGEVTGSHEGAGPMAVLARKMPSRISVNFAQFSSEPIKPETFALPAGYRKVTARLPAPAAPGMPPAVAPR
jgi:hypothetical protein